MKTLASIEITPALDGARVLYRHWGTTSAPKEGFVREFSADKTLVRISPTSAPTDAGVWHRVYDLRVDAVLDAAKAPKKPRREIPPKESDFDGPGLFGG